MTVTIEIPDSDANLVNSQDLIGYLTSKGLEVHRSAGHEVSVHCWECEAGDAKGKGKLYLNTESWLWSCFRCDNRGNRFRLLEYFGDRDGLTYADGFDPARRQRILRAASDLAHDMLLANEKVCQELLDRQITTEQILGNKLGYVPKNVGMAEMLRHAHDFTYKDLVSLGLMSPGGKEFFNDSIVIPYFSHGTIVQLRAKDRGAKYRTLANDDARLFNSDAAFLADELLITEGEFDCLAVQGVLQNCGDRRLEAIKVVGLAGAGTWPAGMIESFAKASKIFIGLDPDETGDRFAAKLNEEIGNRARVVHLPPGLPKTDWSDLLSPRTPTNPNGGRTWSDVRDLLIEADLLGKRIFSVRDASQKWRRMKDERPGLKLGWPSMDAILRPGLKPGQVMIPLAGTGTGKTVFLSNIAHNVRSKGVLYLSLELTASEVFEHFRRIHKFWYPKSTFEEMLLDYDLVHIVEQNRIASGDLNGYIAEYEQITGQRPGLVIIDYLQYFARSFRGNSAYDRLTDAVMELKAVGKEELVPIIAPSQVNRTAEAGKPLSLSHARDAGTVEETADFVMSLFRPDLVTDKVDPNTPAVAPTGNFNAQLLKSRHGGVGRVFNLRFSPMSLVIVDQFDKVHTHQVAQEVSLANQGKHYDDYRKQIDVQVGQHTLPGVEG